MTTSNITITELSTRGGANQINLSWVVQDPHANELDYLRYHHAEIRYSSSISMASPVTLTTSAPGSSYQHLQVLAGATYFYQVRAVNASGQAGEWCDPVAGTELNFDTSAIATPWIDFTPTLAAVTGALGAHTISGRYKVSGFVGFLTIEFTISAVGTGASWLRVDDLPEPIWQFGTLTAVLAGIFNGGGGNISINPTMFGAGGHFSPIIDIFSYSGGNPIAVGDYTLSGTFGLQPV